MAAEPAQNTTDAAAAAPESAPSPTSSAGSGLGAWIVLGVALVNLAVLGIQGFFLQKLWTRLTDIEEDLWEKQNAAEKDGNETTSLAEAQAESKLGVLYPLDGFLVNIASDQGTKYLQVQMELELSDPTLEDEVSQKKAALRDAIIVGLSSQTYRELQQADGMKRVRASLLRTVNSLLSSGKVKEIYFTQFHFN